MDKSIKGRSRILRSGGGATGKYPSKGMNALAEGNPDVAKKLWVTKKVGKLLTKLKMDGQLKKVFGTTFIKKEKEAANLESLDQKAHQLQQLLKEVKRRVKNNAWSCFTRIWSSLHGKRW